MRFRNTCVSSISKFNDEEEQNIPVGSDLESGLFLLALNGLRNPICLISHV